MFDFLSTFEVFLETGLVFSLIAMGYYVSYSVLDFPDLTVEGTFVTGAVTFSLFAVKGYNVWLGLICAFIVGAFFGSITGFLNVRLKIRPLLSGILVSTALLSINIIATTGGMYGDFAGRDSSTSISFGRRVKTLHDAFFGDAIPPKIENIPVRDLVIFLVVAVVLKLALDFYFKSKNGLLLRAAGNNESFVKMLGVDPGNSRITGLAIGNGYAAVAGALYTHISAGSNQSMGIGTIVIGLASLIIGLSIFKNVRFLKPTTKVIIGAVLYQACLTLAQKLGIPSSYNKLIMSVIFTLALILGNKLNIKGGNENVRA